MSNPVPIVGQPFTLTKIRVPVDAELTCNCGAGATITILASVPGSCPGCRKSYSALFNPITGKLDFTIILPPADQVPS